MDRALSPTERERFRSALAEAFAAGRCRARTATASVIAHK
jgi:hypothetical protein